MVFETTVQERNVMPLAGRGVATLLLGLALGVMIGALLAQRVDDLPAPGVILQTGEIIGEDWHGNVRRSLPAQ
ncbi:hypothetical protein ROLI_012890 [Roseobacter fucihabitans]|uniref:Uncharacterized protein n=1 Tax=Roseobacter fucihabitans TaxID=1537242 RepID=A0ABZ2BRZ5_9RHOB|nr:hypothetical protein [Roseobacter litoralis]MBC6964184.1 hypothetical protein [Roseobacter litoralis]